MQRGTAVRSLCGRDKGSWLVVVAVEDDVVFVCDGKERPLERPKKKNPKHLAASKIQLQEADLLHNRPLRKYLRGLETQTAE